MCTLRLSNTTERRDRPGLAGRTNLLRRRTESHHPDVRDAGRSFRKERALTSFTDTRGTTTGVEVEPHNLGTIDDEQLRDQYAAEAERVGSVHDPDDQL
jgi:hypothetical protein